MGVELANAVDWTGGEAGADQRGILAVNAHVRSYFNYMTNMETQRPPGGLCRSK